MNPLCTTWGQNPFALGDNHDSLMRTAFPHTAYREPPPLNQAQLLDKIAFLKEINPQGDTPVFKVRINENIRLLKVVRAPSFYLSTMT